MYMHPYIYSTWAHTHVQIYACLPKYIHMCIPTYLCMPACINMDVNTYIHTYIQEACLPTYIHIQ